MSVPVLPDVAAPDAAAVADAAAARLEKVVDLAAIRHNLGVLREAAGGRKVMAVVKGDAYGLGAEAVAGTLAAAGVDALAVDTVAEGLALRAAEIHTPTLVMDVDVADNATACVDADLMPTIARIDQVERYAALGRRRHRRVSVWLRTNIGFNRFGTRRHSGFRDLLTEVRRNREHLRVIGVFAHLSSAAWDEEETASQAAAFGERLRAARSLLGPGVDGSLAATHGLLHAAALRDTAWVRPGIGLSGAVAATCQDLSGWDGSGLSRLRPAWRVRARVLDVVAVEEAEGLGYDRAVKVAAGQRVASVAIGFSRGITSSSAGFSGLLHGRRCRGIGLPGMDCSQFDVTDVPQVRPGDWLTVLGESGDLTRTAADVSDELGCTLYELMATFTMPVRHVDGTAGRQSAPPERPAPERTE